MREETTHAGTEKSWEKERARHRESETDRDGETDREGRQKQREPLNGRNPVVEHAAPAVVIQQGHPKHCRNPPCLSLGFWKRLVPVGVSWQMIQEGRNCG